MGRKATRSFIKSASNPGCPKPNSIIRLFQLLGFLILFPLSGDAFADDLESGLQKGLEQGKALVATIQLKLQSGVPVSSEISQLKAIAEHIRISNLLIEERFKLREAKVKRLGSKAVERHHAMAEGYRKALTEYLALVDSLADTGSQESVAGSQKKINDIKTLLDKLLPKKKRPIIGSLPYKHLNYPAQEPSTAPEITPAYRGGNKNVGSDDTKDTPEAPISKTIAELAQSLNWQPVAIYEYVKNNIETEWYWGCMKGAEETLHQKSGNDCDQATLLAALLRASGFPTRYVRGTMELFAGGRDGKAIERAKNLTGIDDPMKIAELFQKAGIPYKPIIAGGAISNFQIEHIWVESQIPYANYRGLVIDEHGKSWLGLDTSIKVKDYVYNNPKDLFDQPRLEDRISGARDEYLSFDLNSQPSATQPATPLEYLRSRINSELTAQNSQLTYNDFLRTKTLTPEPMKFLPASLQFKLIKVTGEYTQLPDELVHRVKLSASGSQSSANSDELFDITLPLYKLSNQQITISYEPETVEDQEIINSYGGLDNTPAYLVRLRPVVKINNELIVAAKDGLPMGSEYDLTIELTGASGAQGPEKITSTHIAGNLSVLGIVAQKAVLTPSPLAGEGGGEGAKDAERLLYEAANHYIDRWNKAEDELASLLHLSIARPLPTVVTIGGVIDTAYFMGMPHAFTWKGDYIDANLRTIETVGSAEFRVGNEDERKKLLMKLSSLQGSVLEHRVFEDDFQVSSISTAKLMQLLNNGSGGMSQGFGLLTIDKTNIDAILPTLSVDDNIKEDIKNAVNQNYVIKISQAEKSYLDWTGTGYVKEDPATGQSGWMLSGSIAGGMTAVSPNRWSSPYIKTVMGNPYNDNSRSIYITSPKNESTVSTPYITVTGVVLDPEASVIVNGVQAEVEGTTFTATTALTTGSNTITAVATNKAGRTTFDIIVIRYKIPVKIYITYPFDAAELSVSPIYVEGIVSDPDTSVYVHGIKATTTTDGRFIASNVELAEGANQLGASAMNSDGDLDSQTITINYRAVQPQPSLIVAITSPANGAAINKPSTTIVGTVTSSANEVWITVNGMPAVIYDNQFVVNNVPLINGSNRIIVNAMDGNGGMARQEILLIANTKAPYVKTNVNITSGTAPLTAYFTVSTALTNAIIGYQMDFGDASPLYTGTIFDDINHIYAVEGIYHPKVTVTDSQGAEFTDTITVVVQNGAWFEAILTQRFEGMKAGLASGNIESAVSFFTEGSKEAFRANFTYLMQSLPQLAAKMGEFRLVKVTEHVAEGTMSVTKNGVVYALPVLLIRERNGKWGIRSF